MTPVLRPPSNRKNYVWYLGQTAGAARRSRCLVDPYGIILQSMSNAGTLYLVEEDGSYCLAGQMQGFASFAGRGKLE